MSTTRDKRDVWVQGRPATFETTGEKGWKERLRSTVPRPTGDIDLEAGGLTLRFDVASLERGPQRQGFDVDNLCEPVFAVLVGDLGWFRGSGPRYRNNVLWFRAWRRIALPEGVALAIQPGQAKPPEEEPLATVGTAKSRQLVFEATYTGGLPRGNRNDPSRAKMSDWVARVGDKDARGDDLAAKLRFGPDPQRSIANIVTGVTKLVIDCLYPILGGSAGHPDDHKISVLEVSKGSSDIPADGVEVQVWSPA